MFSLISAHLKKKSILPHSDRDFKGSKFIFSESVPGCIKISIFNAKFLKYSYLRMQNLKRLPNETIYSCITALHIHGRVLL